MSFIIKKFMIGLPLSASLSEWKAFLGEYKEHIECVYFSLPLGRRFHSRIHIANQFDKEGAGEHFLQLIKAVTELQLPLEAVLNTEGLSKNDVLTAAEYLKTNNIEISSLTVLDCYYDYAKEVFRETPLNYSYNNFLNSLDDVDERYNAVIIGRCNIRNTELFSILSKKGIKPVLLLNNGCSHSCGWCHSLSHCNEAFSDAVKKEDPEMLYIKQSIMPFELHEELLDVKDIYCYKINNRNSSLKYLKDCIESYIENKNFEDGSLYRFSLWAKLGWFEPYYADFDKDRIIEEKRKLYSREYVLEEQYRSDKMKTYSVCLNLTDEYTITDYNFDSLLESIKNQIRNLAGNYKFKITAVRLGAETCANLYSFISVKGLLEKARYFSDKGFAVSLVFPVIDESNSEKCEKLLYECAESGYFDSVTVNDFGMLYLAKKTGLKTVFGRMFDKRVRDPRISESEFLEGRAEEAGIFSESYMKLLTKEGITSLEAECFETGFGCGIPSVINQVYLHFPYRYITSGRICEFSGIGEENINKYRISECSMQCMKYVAKTSASPLRGVLYKHCNSLTERLSVSKNMLDLFSMEKASIIYTPEYTGEIK